MELVYFLGLLIPLLIFLLWKRKRKPEITTKNANPQLTDALIKVLGNAPGFESYPDFWLAVSKMETAGFTSRLFTSANNPWGMKMPKVRRSTAIGEITLNGSTWARYATLEKSAEDILLWMKARKFQPGIGNLYSFIQEMKRVGYFEEPFNQYYNLVQAWKNR